MSCKSKAYYCMEPDTSIALNPSVVLKIEYEEPDEFITFKNSDSAISNIYTSEHSKDFYRSEREILRCDLLEQSTPAVLKTKTQVYSRVSGDKIEDINTLATPITITEQKNWDQKKYILSPATSEKQVPLELNTSMILKLECEGSNDLDIHGNQNENFIPNLEPDKININSDHCIVCKICRQQSINVRTFIVHYRIDHMGVKPFVCGKCNVGFDTVTDLKDHHWSHRKRKRKDDDKNKCIYLVKGNNESKIASAAIDDDLYTCDICNECCLNVKNYDVHVRNHIIRNSQFTCSACECSFSDEQNQIRHNTLHHADLTKKFSCNNCNQWFDVRSCYANHVKICIPTHSYICKICFREYISIGKSKFCCNICERDISSIEDLKMKQNLAKSFKSDMLKPT